MGKAAFIGLGAMGEPMANNLINAGHELVVVQHVNSEPIKRLCGIGAVKADSAADAARAAELVFLMLPSSDEVEDVVLGNQGLKDSLAPGTIVVDCSTSDPASTRRVAEALKQRNIGLVDAPVTRGVKGAREGTLAFFIGGDDADVERVLPYLEIMGSNLFQLGRVGNGHTAKIINNMISLSTLALVSEGTYLARSAGLDVGAFFDAVMAGNGKSGTIEAFGQRLIDRDYSKINFRIELATKDLALSQDLAACTKKPFLVSSAAHQMFQFATLVGLSGKDISNIAELWNVQTED